MLYRFSRIIAMAAMKLLRATSPCGSHWDLIASMSTSSQIEKFISAAKAASWSTQLLVTERRKSYICRRGSSFFGSVYIVFGSFIPAGSGATSMSNVTTTFLCTRGW